MSAELAATIQAAATAGWWTILIAAIWMTLVWFIWLGILKSKPQWLVVLWGGEITWDQIRSLMITFMAVMKLILFVGVMLCIWLTLWA